MRIVALGCVFLFFLSSVSWAAPCYGTTLPLKHRAVIGGQTHIIFKRYLEHEAGKIRSTQHFFLLSFGIVDWLAIDLKGGVGSVRQHPIASDELDYPAFMSGGYGFRLKIFEAQKTRAVFGFQHISVHPYSVNIGPTKHKTVLDDWQLSALASYALKNVTPYAGVKLSRCDYIHWVDGERDLVKSDTSRNVGLVCGLDIPLGKKLRCNIEGQWFDGEALAFSLNHQF